MDPSWPRPRVAAFVLALHVLVLSGGVWSVARHRAGYLLDHATAICGLLTVAGAARVVPMAGARPARNAGPACEYEGPGRTRAFTVPGAPESRAFYEDRRHGPDGAPARSWFLLDDSRRGTATGAWADSRIGPVRIYAGGLDAGRLAALAALLARP